MLGHDCVHGISANGIKTSMLWVVTSNPFCTSVHTLHGVARAIVGVSL